MANNEWSTPLEFIESARRVMGSIDVDPASNSDAQKIIKAKEYYTIERSGLNAYWKGNVWLNPPYGSGLAAPFTNLLVDGYVRKITNQAIVLTNNVTDTDWFSETLGEYATAYCFPNKRIQFIPPTGTKVSSNSKGQVLSYFGNNVAGFFDEFSQYGLCVLPWRRFR